MSLAFLSEFSQFTKKKKKKLLKIDFLNFFEEKGLLQ